MKILICLLSLMVVTSAFADESLRPRIASDGKTTMHIRRQYFAGTPMVDLTLTLPANWKQDTSFTPPGQEPSLDRIMFVPAADRFAPPNLTVEIPIENQHAGEAAKSALEASTAPKRGVMGGGKVVHWYVDARQLELGDGVHAYLTSTEIDATRERHTHYVETTCYVYRTDGAFVVRLTGYAAIKDAKLRPELENTCASVRLLPAKK